MKKKITAFIIGAAIWFGMADAARQIDSLQSGANNLIAKTSMFLFSLGSENTPVPNEKKTSQPVNAASTENALAAETKTREVANPNTLAAAKQEKMIAANHSEEETSESSDTIVRAKDFNALVALADEINLDVHSLSEAHVSATASLNAEIDSEIRHRMIVRRVATMQRAAVEMGKKYEVKYSFTSDEKAPKAIPVAAPQLPLPCPPLVSSEDRKLKTVLLVPEVMKQFGE